jgi:AcrR family transcriptional regulator
MSYSAASIYDIALEGGVTQGALYFHFVSKESIALEVIKRQHEISLGAGRDIINAPNLREIEKIVLILHEVGNQIKSDPVVKAGLRLSTESPEFFPDYVTVTYVDWIHTFTKLFDKAIEQGDVNNSMSASDWGNFIVQTFTGTQTVSQVVSQWDDLTVRHKKMWEILIPTIIVKERQEELRGIPNLPTDNS